MTAPTDKKPAEIARQLLGARDVHADEWEELRTFCLPEDPHVHGRDGKQQRLEKPLDGVGVRANQALASGLFSNTITPGQQWFGLRARDEGFHRDSDVDQYLGSLAKHILAKMQASNFTLAAHQMLLRYGAYGTGILFSGYNTETRELYFREFSVTTCGLGEGPDGHVDMIAREFRFTARQAYAQWGDKCHKNVVEEAKGSTTMMSERRYVHLVMPREDGVRDATDPLRKRFASYYIDLDHEFVVEESGYNTFPYQVGRFYKTFDNSPYGTGPGHNCLPELRTLMSSTADWFDNMKMNNYPPIFYPDSDALDIVRQLQPGALIPWNASMGEKPFALQIGGHPELNLMFNEQRREAIETAFFTDLFLSAEHDKQMTATEVQERMAEKIQAIDPVVSRKAAEIDSPLVLRLVALLEENGDMPQRDRPEVLQGSLEVTFQTRFHQRLAQSSVSGFLRSVGNAAMFAESASLAPDLIPMVNVPRAYRAFMRAEAVDPEILNTKVEEEKQRKAMAAQAAQQAEQQAAAAAGARAFRPADPSKRPEPGSPLDRGGVL